ncbi:unnamed protein product [Symbiodinium sp. CCMP2456]|nr:unnamed protein product [Symbiodinium sp. CCMP2456]
MEGEGLCKGQDYRARRSLRHGVFTSEALLLRGSDRLVARPELLADEATQAVASFGHQQLWEEALQLVRGLRDVQTQLSGDCYEALQHAVQRSWPQCLSLLRQRACWGIRESTSAILQASTALRKGRLDSWTWSLRLLGMARERKNGDSKTNSRRSWNAKPAKPAYLAWSFYWDACTNTFQELAAAGNWRWAIHLFGEFLHESPPWESEEFFRMRENLLDLVVMSCGAAGRWRMALSIFSNMRFIQVVPGQLAYQQVVIACREAGAFTIADQLCEEMRICTGHVEHGLSISPGLEKSHLRMCEEVGDWQRALQVLGEMQWYAKEMDEIACGTAAAACANGAAWEAALALQSTEPLVMLGLSLANESRQWERALRLQDLTKRHHGGGGGGGWVSGPLGELLLAVGRWKHALQVAANPDLRVRAAAAGRLWQAAYHLVGGIVESMQQHRVSGSGRCIPASSLKSVLWLHDASAVGLSQQAMNMAVDAVAQKHRWQQAIQLLEAARLLQRSDIITLNTCLTAAVRAESWQQALALLADGRSARLPLSSVSLGAGLDAAQRGSAWQLALGMLSQEGELANAVAINAAAGAAATAACWEIALGLLQDHHFLHNRPDVVACTVAISSCSAASRWEQALSLLNWYGARGVQPDLVTLQQIQCCCDVGMVHLDLGPIPIQYKKNLRRVSSRLLSDGYEWAERRQKGASLAVVAAQALEQWAALSSEDARCVARVLRRPVLDVLQRLRGDPRAQTSARHLPLRDVFLESQSTLGSPMTAETMLDLHLVFTSPSMLRCLAPTLLTASQALRAMLHAVKEGAWSERELWRAAVALFAALCDGMEPTVEQVNLAIEICKEARAIRPMFEMYKSARRLPSFRPDYGTFENLASGGTLAPGQYWWHCLLFMEEAQSLLPRKQLTSSMTKTIKACSDASAWGTALFHLRHAMDLATSTVPGRHARLPELLRERLEVPVQATRSLAQPAPPTRGASSLALPLAALSLAAASRSPKKQRRTLNALTGDAESPHIVRQWRYARRSRLLNSLDWTRYHLWVYFVDSCEPSYARSRLCRFFFEKVCQGHSTASLLYCAAGGLEATQKEEMDLELPASVPDLHSDDLQNLVVPPYTFTPMDFSMYDVVVAADEATAEAVRQRLRETGQSDRDELCVLSDFMDAYDVLLEAEQENPVLEPAPGIAQGILSQDGLAQLMPGQPLRGTPPPRPVGPPLPGLPSAWQELWSVANSGIDELADTGSAQPAEEVGRILHAVVGLERCLRASIPPNMRWWNDEDLRLGNAPERSEGGYKARGWADQWDFQRQVHVRRVGKLRPAVPGVPVPAFQDKVAEFFRACAQDKMGKMPGLSEMLETSYRSLWQRGSRLKVESQELLGLERLSSVRFALREETLQAFRRHRYKSLLGLQLLRGLRRRRALEASWLLRSDVLLEKQSGLGLGTPEALQLVKLSSDTPITVRPHRRTRVRQRHKHGTSRKSRSRRRPSAAWKGRLEVRRAEKEEGGGDCAEIIQAKAAWVSYRLLVDRSRCPEAEVPRTRRAEEIQPLLPAPRSCLSCLKALVEVCVKALTCLCLHL